MHLERRNKMDRKSYVLLLQKGLSQKEIANRMGVHQPKVSEWLNGVRVPNSTSLYKLADVLNEDVEILYYKLKKVAQMD